MPPGLYPPRHSLFTYIDTITNGFISFPFLLMGAKLYDYYVHVHVQYTEIHICCTLLALNREHTAKESKLETIESLQSH